MKLEQKERKVQISICSSGGMSHFAFQSYHKLLEWTMRRTPHVCTFSYVYRTFIHSARKGCAQRAVDEDADYVMFLDDDMVWPRDMIQRLVAIADHTGFDMVSGYYTTRSRPKPVPLSYIRQPNGYYKAWMVKRENVGQILKCDATGFGALLIRTDVFRRLPKPWFEIPDGMTEDIFFFNKCHDMGIPVYVDTGLSCGHEGQYGWCFPTKCETEAQVKGNIIRSDEVLQDNDFEKGNNDAESESEKERDGSEDGQHHGCGREKGSAVRIEER
jgi:glycosyltransferase involved in cell wall biosynthesis